MTLVFTKSSSRLFAVAMAILLASVSLLLVSPGAASAAAPAGTVVGWGNNAYGQARAPSGLSNVVAVAAGGYHTLALKSDGTVVAWGYNTYGQSKVPSGLSDVRAISAGFGHSLALKSDGTVVGWGWNGAGQTDVPPGLSKVVAIAAGGGHSLALKSDGTVIGWGLNDWGQTTDMPPGLSNVVAIAAGQDHNLALKTDGTVVGWGLGSSGQTDVPSRLSNVKAISAGMYHSLALKSDGTVVGWGYNDAGQTDVPSGLSHVKAISAGGHHNVALKNDGTVVSWGGNSYGQTDVPSGLSNVVAVAAGIGHSLAIVSRLPTAPTGLSITKDVAARTATIGWQQPVSSGGSAITGYRVSRDAGTIVGQNPWSTVVSATTRSFTFRFLTVGSTYTLSVAAVNGSGTGPATQQRFTMSSVVPSAPASFTISKSDPNRTATIGWQPPTSNGGSAITGYLVARDAGTITGQQPWSTVVPAGTRSFTFRYLTSGSTYNLSVQALNATEVGPAAAGSVTMGAASSNLIKNSGFEFDTNTDGRPDSWTSNAKFTRSDTSVYTGSFAGRHRATNNTNHTITQVVGSLSAGTGYRFSGRVNIPATSDAFAFQVRVRWLNRAGGMIRTDVIHRYTAATGGWAEAAGSMTSPTGTTKAQVQMVTTNLNATIYVDDFTLGRS